MQALERIVLNQDLFFILLLISFFIVAILKAFYWKATRLLFLGVFRQRYANQYLREDNAFTERVSALTFLLVVFNFSILGVKLKNQIALEDFLIILMSLSVFYILKYLSIQFLGSTFRVRELATLAIFFSFLFDRVMAICILPLLILVFFSLLSVKSIIINLCLVLLCIFFILKLFWLWRIGTNSFGLSPLHIFLYLCMLEIFPLAILAKGLFLK